MLRAEYEDGIWYAYVLWALFNSVFFCLNQILSEDESKYPVACFGYRTRLFTSVSIVCTAEAPGTVWFQVCGALC